MQLPFRAKVSGSNGDRLGSSGHSIQRFDADGDLRHLSIVITGTEAVSNDRFVPAERRLDQRSTAIVGGFLPSHAAVFVDRLDMPIAFGRTVNVVRERCCPTWRNDDRRIVPGLISAHGLIDRITRRRRRQRKSA